MIERFVSWNDDIGDWELKCIAYTGNNMRKRENLDTNTENKVKYDTWHGEVQGKMTRWVESYSAINWSPIVALLEWCEDRQVPLKIRTLTTVHWVLQQIKEFWSRISENYEASYLENIQVVLKKYFQPTPPDLTNVYLSYAAEVGAKVNGLDTKQKPRLKSAKKSVFSQFSVYNFGFYDLNFGGFFLIFTLHFSNFCPPNFRDRNAAKLKALLHWMIISNWNLSRQMINFTDISAFLKNSRMPY